MKNLFKRNSGTFILILFLGVFLVSCSNNDDDDNLTSKYHELIKGTWIVEQTDGIQAETDKIFVVELDGVHQIYAIAQTISNGKEWQEGKNYTYTINGSSLMVNGISSTGKSTELEVEIKSLTNDKMVYVAKKLVIGGELIEDPVVYTFRKKSVDYTDELIGCWKGHETTSGSDSSAPDNYWVYNADGTFFYYFFDQQENKYVKKEDNNGVYHLYGDFMATSFTNKMETDALGRSSECWNIEIEGDSMGWTALRNGKVISFAMTKSKLPN